MSVSRERIQTILRWYLRVRLVVASLVLILLLALLALHATPYPLGIPIALCIIALGVNALYGVWLASGQRLDLLRHLQFALDQALITLGVHLTGDIGSPFLLLYAIPVLSAGLYSGRFAYLQATIGALMIAVLLAVGGPSSSGSLFSPTVVAVVHVTMLYLTAIVIAFYQQQIGKERTSLAEAVSEARDAYGELKATEHALEERNTELQASMRARSEFIKLVSHELRTPLNSVIGFSDLMMDPTIGISEAERQKYLSQIHSSGQHLLAIIDNILDISRADVGQMALELEPVDAKRSLTAIADRMRIPAEGKQLRVTVTAEDGLDPVRADPRRLHQILLTLTENAIKFTSTGGDIRLSASRLQAASAILFEVRDTGRGIPAEHLDHIFEPFYQVDSSASRRYEGTGLGLTVARTLIELQNGSIWAESEDGKGASFFFTLPIYSTQPENTAVGGPGGAEGHSPGIKSMEAAGGQAPSIKPMEAPPMAEKKPPA